MNSTKASRSVSSQISAAWRTNTGVFHNGDEARGHLPMYANGAHMSRFSNAGLWPALPAGTNRPKLLQPEVSPVQCVVGVHRGDGAGKADAAALDGVDPVGEVKKFHVLLGDQEREPFSAEAREHAHDFLDEQRREPGRGLVHDQQARLAHRSKP